VPDRVAHLHDVAALELDLSGDLLAVDEGAVQRSGVRDGQAVCRRGDEDGVASGDLRIGGHDLAAVSADRVTGMELDHATRNGLLLDEEQVGRPDTPIP
jgi:hypothetical protein